MLRQCLSTALQLLDVLAEGSDAAVELGEALGQRPKATRGIGPPRRSQMGGSSSCFDGWLHLSVMRLCGDVIALPRSDKDNRSIAFIDLNDLT